MEYLLPRFLLTVFLFLAPCIALGADPVPMNGSTKPATAEKDPQAAADDQGQASEAAGGADKPRPRKPGPRPTALDVIAQPGGVKALSIHFRWSLYPNSSVEVRLVPGDEAKKATVSPIYFAENLTGKVRDEFYTCLDHTGEGGHTYNFTKDKITYKMIGRRNALEKQGVHVQVHAEEGKKAAEEYPSAAYLQLDTWAVDRETLSLDMPRDEFAKPGTLFVWFFRGDKAVWDEQIHWPGYK
jgi:hypothetical protein